MARAARLFVVLGALLAALGVALGAYGAHALKAKLAPEALAIYQTAVQYHMWHALGLVAVGLLCNALPGSGWLRASGWLLTAGIMLFSGSLYLLAVTGTRWFGALTPLGGSALMLGWLALALALLRA
ncbi:MAG TPA: DUF423 domain-containing protein [Burkholderiales bacterium]|nr:DUF423 domain-containing protein [Burkholderiales bacterium]